MLDSGGDIKDRTTLGGHAVDHASPGRRPRTALGPVLYLASRRMDMSEPADGDSTVLLTGGTSGIGAVAARKLAADGATVAIVGSPTT